MSKNKNWIKLRLGAIPASHMFAECLIDVHAVRTSNIYNEFIKKFYIWPIKETILKKEGSIMFCSSCGAKMEDSARFCPECGAVNEKANVAPDENSVTSQAPISAQPVQTPPPVQEIEPSKPKAMPDTQSVQAVNKSNDALLKYIKSIGKKKLIISGAVVAVVLIAIISLVVVLSKPKPQKGPGPQKVDTVSTLEKVVKNSSLSTYEVVYNGVTTVYNEKKPEDVDYHVSYTATIKAGFDFKSIKVTKDEENHEIVFSLPPIELYEPKVKIEELDYIVVNKKIKTETISADAYKVCKADAEKRSKNQEAIFKYAKENGERLIKGLATPFIDKMDEKYTIKFEWRDFK